MIGPLRKMHVAESGSGTADYQLRVGDEHIALNEHVGTDINLTFTGNIYCVHCGNATRRSYSQGYCYPCFTRLPQTDLCMMSPDRCHFHLGTCRDETFGRDTCMQPHLVYLANSSGIKVGITRPANLPTRWLDQGAIQAMVIAQTTSRRAAGLFEAQCRAHISDRTQWQRMLMTSDAEVDLHAHHARLMTALGETIASDEVGLKTTPTIQRFHYPVVQYPQRVVALDPHREPTIEAGLLGIKGQYLILDTGVINIRKYGGYEVSFTPLHRTSATATQLSLL